MICELLEAAFVVQTERRLVGLEIIIDALSDSRRDLKLEFHGPTFSHQLQLAFECWNSKFLASRRPGVAWQGEEREREYDQIKEKEPKRGREHR
jgi:hypothetical protein